MLLVGGLLLHALRFDGRGLGEGVSMGALK